ncbi:MAG: pentapeptide repeat-containing protein [Pseudomonadota bacterium]|nr:pentapeptide repeat-containing protein [Pseudomonadota bacterium]
MKPFLTAVVVLTAAAAALPALAQNAGQIARVRGGASCAGCNLFQGNFSGLEARGLNLSGARLRQADLSLVVMNRTRFSNADMRDVEAYGGVFSNASFAGANMTNASFVGAFLDGANFSGATLDGANFGGASLQRATGLSQSRLNRACGDEATQLPRGLTIPRC